MTVPETADAEQSTIINESMAKQRQNHKKCECPHGTASGFFEAMSQFLRTIAENLSRT